MILLHDPSKHSSWCVNHIRKIFGSQDLRKVWFPESADMMPEQKLAK